MFVNVLRRAQALQPGRRRRRRAVVAREALMWFDEVKLFADSYHVTENIKDKPSLRDHLDQYNSAVNAPTGVQLDKKLLGMDDR